MKFLNPRLQLTAHALNNWTAVSSSVYVELHTFSHEPGWGDAIGNGQTRRVRQGKSRELSLPQYRQQPRAKTAIDTLGNSGQRRYAPTLAVFQATRRGQVCFTTGNRLLGLGFQ